MKVRIKPESLVRKDYPWMEQSWRDSAARSPNMIYDAILDLGIRDKEITNDLYNSIDKIASQDLGFRPNSHAEPKPITFYWITETIKSWFTGIKIVEEDSIQFTQEVPLFLLNSPTFQGAKTICIESESHENSLGWKIDVLGSGYGADLTLTITHEGEFTSSDGDQKLIFAPLNVQVVKASLYKRGVFQENFLKAELVETEVREANGIRSISPGEWKNFTLSKKEIDRFNLSGDKSKDISKYKRKYSIKGSFESRLGLKAFDLETSLFAKYATEHSIEVVFELPPGRAYKLWQPTSMPGFFFNE